MEEKNNIYSMDDRIYLSMASPYNAPKFVSVRNKDYIPCLDNDGTQYFDNLIDYKNESALHGAILKNMGAQVAGNGVIIDKNGSNYEATKLFLNNFGKNGETINEIIERIASDLCDFKGFAILVSWSKDGKKIINGEHVDFSKIRCAKANAEGVDKGKIPGYYYSWNWDKQRHEANFIPAFAQNTMADKKKRYDEALKKAITSGQIIPELQQILTSEQEQLLYCHPYASNEFYYPLPYYVGAINAIIADTASDKYAIGQMENGLSANHIIVWRGNFTEAEKKKMSREFIKAHIKNVKKGFPVQVFAKDTESTIEIKKIDSNGKDEKYTSINENSTQKIIEGHGVTSPMLVGVKTAGSLGGSEELKIAEDLFYRNTIRPKQNFILKVLNNILKINNLDPIKIEQLTLFPENEEIENKK